MTTDTTAVTPYNGVDADEEGSLGLTADQIRLPHLRFSGKEGHFGFVGDTDTTEEVKVVPLRMMIDTRIKWPKSDDDDADDRNIIECRSNDAIRPVDPKQAAKIGAGGPTHDSCKACPYSLFRETEDGKRKAPLCTLFKNIAFASLPENEDGTFNDEEEPMPFLFSVKSTSIKPLMNALNVIELRRRRSKERKPGFAFSLRLVAGAQTGTGKRKYYPLEIIVTDQLVPVDMWPSYGTLWQWVKEMATRIDFTAPDEETEAEEAADADSIETTATPVQPNAKDDVIDTTATTRANDGDPGPSEPPAGDPALQGELVGVSATRKVYH